MPLIIDGGRVPPRLGERNELASRAAFDRQASRIGAASESR